MCVICFVPKGHDLPSRSDLFAMHCANPHGMGFASKSLSYKGMDFNTFYNRLQYVPKDEDIIIHFRFATHGSINAANCHPFKRGRVWFAHNGILDIEPDGDKTDSQTAFDDIIYPAIRRYGIDSIEVRNIIYDIIGYSKFAFIGDDGRARLFGRYEKFKGCLCSNLNFIHRLRYTPRYSFAV